MRIVAVAVYKPKGGKTASLLSLLKRHRKVLRKARLITRKHAYVMASNNGSIVEVFEWVSAKAKTKAHEHAAWRALWPKFDELCVSVALNRLPESRKQFANFDSA